MRSYRATASLLRSTFFQGRSHTLQQVSKRSFSTAARTRIPGALHAPASAVSKLPTELWELILYWAVHVPCYNSIEKEFEELRRPVEPSESALIMRMATERIRIFSSVCRTWWEMLQPMLLEQVVLACMRSATATALLNDSFKGRFKAEWVRKLVVRLGGHSDPFAQDEFCWLRDQGAELVRLIEHCTGLEEFSWDTPDTPIPSPIITTLAASCCRTLTAVYIRNDVVNRLPLCDLAALITQCTRLRVLICPDSDAYRTGGMLKLSAVPTMTRSFVLHTLLIELDESRGPWTTFLFNLSLPHLKCLSISLGRYTEEESDEHLNPLRTFLQDSGQQILSLKITVPRGRVDNGGTLAIFNLCPSLEAFIFCADSIRITSGVVPHPSLRHIGIERLFLSGADIGNPRVPIHIQTMTAVLSALCSPNCPSMEVLRSLDQVPVLDPTYEKSLYHRFAQDMIALCGARRVRFEGLAEHPFLFDFETRNEITAPPSSSKVIRLLRAVCCRSTTS